jgi:hypothetical protein
MSSAQSPPISLAWAEIGRGTPGDGAPWIVCIAPVGESGAFYRTQIVVDSLLTVTVDLIAHRGAPVRRVHRTSCIIPPDVDAFGEPIQELAKAADEAAWTVLRDICRDGPQPGASISGSNEGAVEPLPIAHRQATMAANQPDQLLRGP